MLGGPPSLVRGWPLDSIDDHHFDRRALRIQLQPECSCMAVTGKVRSCLRLVRSVLELQIEAPVSPSCRQIATVAAGEISGERLHRDHCRSLTDIATVAAEGRRGTRGGRGRACAIASPVCAFNFGELPFRCETSV